MKNLTSKKTIVWITISFFFIHCGSKAFPDEQMRIDFTLANIFKSVASKDSISFSNEAGKKKLFIIEKIDSILTNRKNVIMAAKPYNNWKMTFTIVENGKALESKGVLFVNRDPTENRNSILIELNDFYYHADSLPKLRSDSLIIKNAVITNYYRVNPNGNFGKDYNVEALYIDEKNGFIGFEMKNGEIWSNDSIK